MKKNIYAIAFAALMAVQLTGCSFGKDESSIDLSTISSAMLEEGTTEAIVDDYAYTMNADGTVSISGYTGTDVDLVLPTTINGYVVSAIGDHAFEANWNLKSVVIPSGVAIIGESAFSDCGNLESVVIADTVGTIRRGAFISCTALTTLDIPMSVGEIMEEAFTGCAGLTDITIRSSLLEYANWWIDVADAPAGLTITCPSGSPVEAWAKKNGIQTAAL